LQSKSAEVQAQSPVTIHHTCHPHLLSRSLPITLCDFPSDLCTFCLFFNPLCSSPFVVTAQFDQQGLLYPELSCLSLTSSRSFAHTRFLPSLNGFITTITPFLELDPPSWQFHALTRHVKPPEPSELLDPEYPATGFTNSWSCLAARSIADKEYKGWVEDDFSMSLKELDTFWIPELANRR
jgi:hypothetical protein